VPLAVTLNSGQSGAQFKTTSRQTYVFDQNEQKILAIDPITGAKTGDVALDCAPSTLKLSPDGKLLFVPCLASNELVVIDTGSNLVKTRIPVGQRPESIVYVYPTKDVVISNRYSPFLSVIGSEELVSGETIKLADGASGGAMALIPGEKLPKLIVADAFKPVLYMVDVLNKRVEKVWQALPEISSILVLKNDKGLSEVWVASRTENKLMVLDDQGRPLKTLDVGKKPVDLVAFDKKVYVLSAGDSQLQLIDAKEKTVLETTPLEADGFPSGIVTVPTEKLAYVSMAASRNLLILNLESGKVERSLPVEFRASMIGMTPDKLEAEQFPAIAPADLPPAKPVEEPVAVENKKPVSKTKEKKEKIVPAVTKTPAATAGATNTATSGKPTASAPQSKKASSAATIKPVAGQGSKSTPDADTGRMIYPSPQSGVIATPGANGGKFRLNVIKLGRSGHDEKATPQKAEKSATSAKPVKKGDSAATVNTQASQETPASAQNANAATDAVKAGARMEQKPLAIPLDLPAESNLPATGQSSAGKQEALPLKDDKIKGDKIE